MLQAAAELDRSEFATMLMAFPVRRDESSSKGLAQEMWPDSPIELAIGGSAPNGEKIRCDDVLAHRFVFDFFSAVFDGFNLEAPAFDEDESDDEVESDKADGKASVDNSYFNDETNEWIHTTSMEPRDLPIIGRVFIKHGVSSFATFLAFWQIPRVKWLFHMFASTSYLLLVVIQLNNGFPWDPAPWMLQSDTLAREIQWPEIVNFVWAGCRLLEETQQMVKVGTEEYIQSRSWGLDGALAYFSSGGNLLDLFNLGTVLLIGVLRVTIMEGGFDGYNVCWPMACTPADVYVQRIAQSLYAIVVVGIFLRYIDSLKFFQGIGVLYITLLKMFIDVGEWIKITVFITIGFGVAYAVLMPGASGVAQGNANWLERPFWQPFWGLLGDFDTGAVFDYYATEDFPASTIMPIMLAAYNFVTSIILVNLLIAQMSARYEVMQEVGYSVWLAERISLIKEYKDEREELPPPLNLIRLFVYTIPRLLMRCASMASSGSQRPGARGGFKLELRGPSINHARDAALKLCQDSIEEEEEADDEASKHKRLMDTQTALTAQVEILIREVSRIKDIVGRDSKSAQANLEQRSKAKKRSAARQAAKTDAVRSVNSPLTITDTVDE